MSDPKRLLDSEEAQELSRQVLTVGSNLTTPPTLAADLWKDLTPHIGPPSPPSPSAPPAPPASPATIASGASVVAWKVAGGLALAASLVAGGYAAWTRGTPSPTAPASSSIHAVVAPPPASSASSPFPAPAVSAETSSIPATPSDVPPKLEGTTAKVQAAPSPELEATYLQKARACLAAHDAACARRNLREAERNGTPLLGEERAALAVRVTFAEGRTEEGRTLARKFLARYPNSPLAPSIASSLSKSEAESK
ncbi:MAG: hypothetical protein U0174_10805 [Polyangiaceae bacterium]